MPVNILNLAFKRVAGVGRNALNLLARRAVVRVGRVRRNERGALRHGRSGLADIGVTVRVLKLAKAVSVPIRDGKLRACRDAPHLGLQVSVRNIDGIGYRIGGGMGEVVLRRRIFAIGKYEAMLDGGVEADSFHRLKLPAPVRTRCS
jgi:hypothetical protein